jgi:hypothetical protein
VDGEELHPWVEYNRCDEGKVFFADVSWMKNKQQIQGNQEGAVRTAEYCVGNACEVLFRSQAPVRKEPNEGSLARRLG